MTFGGKKWSGRRLIVVNVWEKMLAKHSSGRSQIVFFLGAHFKNAKRADVNALLVGRGANTYEANRT